MYPKWDAHSTEKRVYLGSKEGRSNPYYLDIKFCGATSTYNTIRLVYSAHDIHV